MLESDSVIDKINKRVFQLQNYRETLMDLSTPEKLRSYRYDLINFFYELEREIKLCTQMIKTLSSENTNLNEKIQLKEITERELYYENLSLKEYLSKTDSKMADLVHSNSCLELKLSKRQDQIDSHNKELVISLPNKIQSKSTKTPLITKESNGSENNSPDKNFLNNKEVFEKIVNDYLIGSEKKSNKKQKSRYKENLGKSNTYEQENKELTKIEKVTNSLLNISRNDKLKSLCEERFGKDYFAKLLSNPDDKFLNSLTSFLNELKKYDFLNENTMDENINSRSVRAESSNCQKTNKSFYSVKNPSEILKKKNNSQFRPSGNFSKSVFNKYTSSYGQYFDPGLQHGGESIYSDKDHRYITTESNSLSLSPKKRGNRMTVNSNRFDYDYDKKICDYREIPWNSTLQYFTYEKNQRMTRSPDKVTSNIL